MLIVALVLAVVGLAALVTAVVTSNELVAWVCIAASVIGVILLIIDAIRERQRTDRGVADDDEPAGDAVTGDAIDDTYQNFDAEYPEESESATAEPPAEALDPPTEAAAEAPTEAVEPAETVETVEPAEPSPESADSTDQTDSKPATN